MGSLGDLAVAVSGKPKVSVTSLTKSPQLQGYLDTANQGFQTLQSTGDAALSDYIKNYIAGTPAATARTGAETASIDRFYNGGVEKQLADIRSRRQAAVTAAAQRSSDAALAGIKGNMVAGGGGGGSYWNRMALRNLGDIGTNAALDNSNQERNDYGFLLGGQQANYGRSNALADSLAGRALVPYQARQNMFASQLGDLGSLQGLDAANHFYGLEKERNQGAEITGAVGNVISDLVSLYATGGAAGVSKTTAPGAKAGGSDASYGTGVFGGSGASAAPSGGNFGSMMYGGGYGSGSGFGGYGGTSGGTGYSSQGYGGGGFGNINFGY